MAGVDEPTSGAHPDGVSTNTQGLCNILKREADAIRLRLMAQRGWSTHQSNGWCIDTIGGYLYDSPNWLRAMLDLRAHHEPGWRAGDEIRGFALWLGESGFAMERVSMIEHVYRLIPAPVVVHQKPEKGSALRQRAERAGTVPSGPLALSQALIPGPLGAAIVDILIARLNALVVDETFAADALRLMGSRVACLADLSKPRLRAVQTTNANMLGFLGLLNGIVGALPDGAGRIASVVEDGRLIGFTRVSTWSLEDADSNLFVSDAVGAVVADMLREDFEAIDRREAAWQHDCPWALVMELANMSLSRSRSDAGSTS